MSITKTIPKPAVGPSTLSLFLAFAAVYLIWGSTYLFVRFATETLPPFLLASTRYLIAGSLIFVYAIRQGARPITRHDILAAIPTGFLLILIGNGGVTWALQYVPSGLTAILIATEPLWVVLLAWVWYGKAHKPNAMVLAGMIIGFLGMIYLIYARGASVQGETNLPAVLVILLSSVAWAVGSLLVANTPGRNTPAMNLALQMLAGGVMLLMMGTLAGDWAAVDVQQVSAKSFLSYLFLVFFGTLVAYTAYNWLLRSVSPSLAATHAYVNPVVAVLLGWAFADERLSWQTLLASGIIVASVVLVISREKD
ncbi:EamA family transporter [Nibrella viscosa]|uniref:EamA family transporter n=1 Tax=Nibrella viscosa TaxID=1084524 RepID=UPI0031E7D872